MNKLDGNPLFDGAPLLIPVPEMDGAHDLVDVEAVGIVAPLG